MVYNINSIISYLSYKDFKNRRQINLLNELKIKLIKCAIYDIRLKFNLRFLLKTKYLTKFGLKSNIYIHSCLLTGKHRFVFNKFNFNRSSLKFYASHGFIAGFQKW